MLTQLLLEKNQLCIFLVYWVEKSMQLFINNDISSQGNKTLKKDYLKLEQIYKYDI